MPERIDADVCVVGAGYAGLTAARRLSQGGKSVVVLEARDRVGGRIWTQNLADGSPVDRGGAWLAPYHDRALALAGEVGVSTYKTWVKGAHLLIDGDRTRRYTGLIPKISPLAVGTIALAQARLDWMAKKIPIDAPWDAKRAKEWDARTVADFVAHSGIRTKIGRELFEMAVRGLFSGDLNDTSFLNFLFLVRAHHSVNNLFSIEKGAQENLIVGGAGSIAHRMVDELGDAVRLNAPVRSITHNTDHVVVDTGELVVNARHAVVTIPPALVADLTFDPVLPDDRLTLCRAAVAGPESKTIVVYDEPFWRADGFSGQTAGPGSAAEVTIDASPASGTPGVIASFTFGRVATKFDALEPAVRRKAVVDALTARLGPRAASPVDFIETAWWTEQYTRGCSMAHFPPGILTRYGPLLRQPMGRVHWAGTETSTTSHGAIDDVTRRDRRRHPFRRTRRHRNPRPHLANWRELGAIYAPNSRRFVDRSHNCVGSTARGAGAVFGHDDVPVAWVECGDGGFDGHLYLAGRGRWFAGHGVDREVADKEECSAGRDAGGQASHHLLHRSGDVHVQRTHQLEVARRRYPTAEIAFEPRDAFGDIGTKEFGRCPRVFERSHREVDGGNAPAGRREPDRFRAVAAARVESSPRRKVGNLRNEVRVRRTARDGVRMLSQRLRPALFPEVAIEFLIGHVA